MHRLRAKFTVKVASRSSIPLTQRSATCVGMIPGASTFRQTPNSRSYFNSLLGHLLLVIATAGLTAKESPLAMKSEARCMRLLEDKRIYRIDIQDAGHRFSRSTMAGSNGVGDG
jgi:hypothetical protein